MSSSGVKVVGSDAPSDYHVAPRTTENPSQVSGSVPQPPVTVTPPQVVFTPPPAVAAGVDCTTTGTKKRGRPRKYALDGSVTKVISPKPISSSAPPPVIDFSAAEKRGKICPLGSAKKRQNSRIELESLDPYFRLFLKFCNGRAYESEWVSCSIGTNFTPHIITANAGEDVTMKIISFSQQGPRSICVLSANGVISSVTLRQPDSSGGTLTYEGRFNVLSLTGLFMPSDSGGMRNRSGGMSVSLASPNGRVVGGGIAGLLVAASPVEIVIGSFLAGNQLDQKTKKYKAESTTVTPAAVPISTTGVDDPYCTPPSFHADNLSMHPNSSNKPADIDVAVTGEYPNG